MTLWSKVGAVAGGYGVAIVAGIVAAWLYNLRVSALPYDTSGGMYAGGETLSALATFLVVALVPTMLGLWFLRPYRRFWNLVAFASLAYAGIGLIAVLTQMGFRGPSRHAALLMVELLGLSQLLGAPLWFVTFALFAWLAPTREARGKLILAVVIEALVGVCAFIHWFAPSARL